LVWSDRELALQVSEGFSGYAALTSKLSRAPDLRRPKLPAQLNALRRACMWSWALRARHRSHESGTLKLIGLRSSVLDEPTKCCSGFRDASKAILWKNAPAAAGGLFSATMAAHPPHAAKHFPPVNHDQEQTSTPHIRQATDGQCIHNWMLDPDSRGRAISTACWCSPAPSSRRWNLPKSSRRRVARRRHATFRNRNRAHRRRA